MGTPEFAVPPLEAVASSCDVALVVTQPDRPKGRGRALAASPVAERATALGLPVLKPEHMKAPEVRERLAAERADVFAVVAFGAILTPEVLALPRCGAINLHGSVLPDYRGASPVQRALWDGRTETGVCTIFMDEGIDTGDVIMSQVVPIAADDDAGTLAAKLSRVGAPLLNVSCLLAASGTATRTPQDRAAGSYAKKLRKQDGVVDWALDASVVWHHQRAVTPWPGATALFGARRLIVTKCEPLERAAVARPAGEVMDVTADGVVVACGSGALRLVRVKPEGRGEQSAAEWARGARVEQGQRFEQWKENAS